eukprot:340616-Amphidinium_carterae.1
MGGFTMLEYFFLNILWSESPTLRTSEVPAAQAFISCNLPRHASPPSKFFDAKPRDHHHPAQTKRRAKK